jgi:mannosyltransferase OCH1-like enzyme
MTEKAWYIPSEWTSGSKHQPRNIVDAAVIASRAALSDNTRTMTHSSIPLVLHQTWKNTNIDTWSDNIRGVTEKWLEYVVSNNMAYVLWDDVGINQVLEDHEWSNNEIWPSGDETSVLTFIERTDVFRILLCSLFGGIVRLFSFSIVYAYTIHLPVVVLILVNYFSTPI